MPRRMTDTNLAAFGYMKCNHFHGAHESECGPETGHDATGKGDTQHR